MQRAKTLTVLLAVSVAIGLTGFAGTAAAEPPVSVSVDTEPAEDCEETLATPLGDVTVERPCEVAETETCETVIRDHMGMPYIVEYPCEVTVKTPSADSASSAEPDVICWGVTEDPMGMPVLYPYPCLK